MSGAVRRGKALGTSRVLAWICLEGGAFPRLCPGSPWGQGLGLRDASPCLSAGQNQPRCVLPLLSDEGGGQHFLPGPWAWDGSLNSLLPPSPLC